VKRFAVLTALFVASVASAEDWPAWREPRGDAVVMDPGVPVTLLINDLVYCLADDGTMFLLKSSGAFEILARNSLGEECHATPAVSRGQLFIRTTEHLWCIGH
jgi:hypothetical protein